MKVLVFTNLFPNSINPLNGIFTLKRMGHFDKLEDCQIKVVAPVPYVPAFSIFGRRHQYSRIKKKEIIKGIEVYHPRYLLIPKITMLIHGFSMFLGSIRTVQALKKKYDFDIIDAHFIYPDGFAAVLLSRFTGKPLVVSALGSDIHEFSKFKFIRPMIRRTLKSANRVVSVCDALKQHMVGFGIPGSKIDVIPSGVDTKRFCPMEKDEARKKLGIPLDRTLILSVGSLVELKGFQTILATLPKLVNKNHRLSFYIVGDGPFKSELYRIIKSLNIDDSVYMVGQRPNHELALWYNASDIFCLASFREGWPNVVMEALACGTPVVATRVFGTPEIITSPKLGILVEPNAESIGKGLLKAMITKWDRQAIADSMKNKTWHHIAREIQSVFEKILKIHRKIGG